MDNKNNNFTLELANTIVNSTADTLIDIGEIGIDSVITDELIKQFPFAKTIYSVSKAGIAIREKFLLKKTYIFIKQLSENNVDSVEYEEYKTKLKNNDKYLFEELERIIIILDRILEPQKAVILANLYSAFINKNLSIQELQDFYMILDNLLLNDIQNLKLLYKSERIYNEEKDHKGVTNRLISLGLAYKVSDFLYDKENRSLALPTTEYKVILTEYGKKFLRNGLLFGS